MSAVMLAKGVLTWIPGVRDALYNRKAAHGTGSAAYCYGVWIKHLAMLSAHGMKGIPHTVLEFGPGESVGTGVAALLSGAERYIAIDAVAHVRPEANLAVFRELTRLFEARAPRPSAGYPPIDQYLDRRLFPGAALDEQTLARSLAPERLDRIENAVREPGAGPDPMIRYVTWSNLPQIPDGKIDLAFSHVVLNHVEDLESFYARCARWVRPGGWMSHQIDFKSLGTAREWNGHRAYGELAWKVIAGKRPYFVNREPLSTHLELLQSSGFEVVHLVRGRMDGGITRAQLAPRWRGISDDDLASQTGYFVCRRRGA